MKKVSNNLFFRYLFILHLGLMLLMAQTSGLHFHVQHKDHTSVTPEHVVGIHATSTLDDISNHSQDLNSDHHAAIDIGQDYLVKKTGLLSQLLLCVFFMTIFLSLSRLSCVFSRWHFKTPTFSLHCHSLQPPLRAPPAS